jgi:hypothetical protein
VSIQTRSPSDTNGTTPASMVGSVTRRRDGLVSASATAAASSVNTPVDAVGASIVAGTASLSRPSPPVLSTVHR